MDTRLQDNSSPEPSTQQNQDCFKTPDINTFNQFNSILNLGSLYPTPPSDNDEVNSFQHDYMPHIEQNFMYTPTITITNQYYGTNINSGHSDSNNTSLESATYHSPELPKTLQYTDYDTSPKSTSRAPEPQAVKPPTQTGSRFKRRSRTTFSKSQLNVLEQTFQKSQYPEIKTVDDLCDLLHLSTERISIWFQNRRARFKKQRKQQAESTGYATAPSAKPLESYNSSMPNYHHKYSYDNACSTLYATPPQMYNDAVIIKKIENYSVENNKLNSTENNENIDGYSGQMAESVPVLSQQFYPQSMYYQNNSYVTPYTMYQSNLP